MPNNFTLLSVMSLLHLFKLNHSLFHFSVLQLTKRCGEGLAKYREEERPVRERGEKEGRSLSVTPCNILQPYHIGKLVVKLLLLF